MLRNDGDGAEFKRGESARGGCYVRPEICRPVSGMELFRERGTGPRDYILIELAGKIVDLFQGPQK